MVNVSEGRDARTLAALGESCGRSLIDRHADPDHHRSVFTLAGATDEVEQAARSLTALAVERLTLAGHDGRHPRFGVVDVVPFVPLPAGTADLAPAIGARDRFAAWAAGDLHLPCFLYGPIAGTEERSLPEVRRGAFDRFLPDAGPPTPHPTAGAIAVGARGVLVAYNLWLGGGDVTLARSVAAALRGPAVRTLAFELATGVQVSCNLLRPLDVGPAQVYEAAARLLSGTAARIDHCELVGLLPLAVLRGVGRRQWETLGLDERATIEARLAARTLS